MKAISIIPLIVICLLLSGCNIVTKTIHKVPPATRSKMIQEFNDQVSNKFDSWQEYMQQQYPE